LLTIFSGPLIAVAGLAASIWDLVRAIKTGVTKQIVFASIGVFLAVIDTAIAFIGVASLFSGAAWLTAFAPWCGTFSPRNSEINFSHKVHNRTNWNW
jgi:hypothetical protein